MMSIFKSNSGSSSAPFAVLSWCSTMLIFETEIDRGRSMLFDIEFETDELINFNVMLRPQSSYESPYH